METDKTHNTDGRFVAGHHIGRPKGSGNKKLNAVREKFQLLLDGYSIQQMQVDLMEMEAGERLRLIVAMGDFFLPKLNRVDNSLTIGNDTIIVLPVGPVVPVIDVPLIENNDNRPLESEAI